MLFYEKNVHNLRVVHNKNIYNFFFLSNGANTNNLRKKKLATLMDWFHNMQVVFGLMKFI